MSKKDKDRKKVAVRLTISEGDLCRALEYEKFIERHLEQRNPVPLHVFKKFISFVQIESEREEVRHKYNKDLLNKVLDRFPEYQFTGYKNVEEQDIPQAVGEDEEGNFIFEDSLIKIRREEYNMETLLDSVISTIQYEINKDKKWTKGHCVRQVYLQIDKRINEFSKKNQKFLTHYRTSVIATFISIELGYIYTNRKPKNDIRFSASELYDMSKAELDKIPVEEILNPNHPKKKKPQSKPD